MKSKKLTTFNKKNLNNWMNLTKKERYKLTKQDSLNYMDKRKLLLEEIRNEYKKISRKLRNYDLLVELDLSGASFSKQFKKANKLKSKSIIVIGDDEAVNREFIIRLFDQSVNGNEEEVISFENDIELEKWINNNLLAK